ncbi:MAG: SLC5 family protein [Planctomycetota bacterium]
MKFGALDVLVFVGFVVAVVAVGLAKSAKKKTSEDYFLAGRGLRWWLIGFSLIAANISTEQFVGMSGNAASHVGLAIASYEWMAAITLVVVAFAFLPYFLRAGIYTMPEFLEYRYNTAARTFMAVVTLFIYMLLLGAITYAGALTIRTLAGKMDYEVSLSSGALVLGVIAMLYVAAGGLRACAWADLIQGSSLILGGVVIMAFGLWRLGTVSEAARIVDVGTGAVATEALSPAKGALERFWDLNAVRLNMFLPADDPVVPWTALLVGLWIPNFYYWGLNQYITQRTLGSVSLAQGQRGIVFAAFLKLLIPFGVVVPGILAFNLFHREMHLESTTDNAPIIARYLKAHPETKFVETAESPSEETIASWKPGRCLIAIYPDEASMRGVRALNPYVLPIAKKDFEAVSVAPFTVFESEDKAWRHVNAEFAAEMDAYNAATKEAAEAAGTTTSKQKPIVYKYDTGMAQLIGTVLPQGVGVVGFVLAALLGAVVSSLAALLNAASTIFSMDVFKKFVAPRASQPAIVLVGRICVVVYTAIAVLLAPQLGRPNIKNSIFTIIQESQGFISPGILAAFAFGIAVRRGPPWAAVASIGTNLVAYFVMMQWLPGIQFLNRMAICFALCLVVMGVMTRLWPLEKPVVFERRTTIGLEGSTGAAAFGVFVVLLTLALYVIFSPLVVAR